MANETIRTRNRLALTLLVVGKVIGIAGLVVGSSHRALGGLLLGIDGIFIVVAIAISMRAMKAVQTNDDGHKALLRQMMKEGTLKQHLRDLEAEMAGDANTPKSGDAPLRTD